MSLPDALGAHIRDELGVNEISQAKPIQAVLASGAAISGPACSANWSRQFGLKENTYTTPYLPTSN